MFISASTFVLFGALCVANPDDPTKWQSCFNFWQDPIVHYKTAKECKKAANSKAQEIKDIYDEHHLELVSISITCINTGIEKSLKIEYNIL